MRPGSWRLPVSKWTQAVGEEFGVYKSFPFFTCPRKYIFALLSTLSKCKRIDPFRGKIGCTFCGSFSPAITFECCHRERDAKTKNSKPQKNVLFDFFTYFLFCFLAFSLLVGRILNLKYSTCFLFLQIV